MAQDRQTSNRKLDHIRINLEENVQSQLTSGLERIRLVHQALPEIDLEDVKLSLRLFGRELQAPILISSMTGGTDEATRINRALATAAQQTGVAMGLGSQRAAIEDAGLQESYRLRDIAPDILLFANVGAVQLNYGYGVEHCRTAVSMADADGLILHLNPLQEAVQPEGDTRFAGLLRRIERVCQELDCPVIVKEVGWGISERTARQLEEAGVAAIDVAGAGGTSWSEVERHRSKTDLQAKIAAAFIDWGIPTVESIRQTRHGAANTMIFASGGIRSGIDIAKCIALGATLGGMASPFLRAAGTSFDDVVALVEQTKRELQVSMFAAGAANLEQLAGRPIME